MAMYKATGTISWFDFQNSQVQFNADEKVKNKNIFLNADDPKNWNAVSLEVSTVFSVNSAYKNVLWNVAQSGSSVIIYIKDGNFLKKCPKNNCPSKECKKCTLYKSTGTSNWTIVNIELGNKNEN